jgi:hypothetical protein
MVTDFRISPAARPPLRIGLLLDSPMLSAFSAKIIEDIKGSNFAKLELLVFRKTAPPPHTGSRPPSPIAKIVRQLRDRQLREHALYNLYLRLDKRMKPSNHPLDPVDCSHLLRGIETIEVEPIGKKFVHRFPLDALESIRSKDLDVLIRFGFNILRGEILQAARYGVWSYHHGDNEFYRGGPPHFWELYEGAPLSGVVLQVLTEDLDGGLLLSKSLFATQKTISVSRNRYAPYWGSTDLMIRKLNELHQQGWNWVEQRAVPSVPYKGRKKIYKSPTNLEIIRWLGPVFLKKAVHSAFRRKSVPHWQIGIRLNGRTKPDSDSNAEWSEFRWIESPKGHFWADPFGIEHQGKAWAFFEDFSYLESRGRIACAEISPAGTLISPTYCLEHNDHHYSYPYVFRSGDELFMVPEAFDSDSVDLYRCDKFPTHWTLERTLLRGRFVDTTIWHHDGLWWLTTTSAEPDARAGCLLLYYSSSLNGDWQFHPANPISTDIRNNRGAGTVFRDGSRLIRPSQSSCPVYGYSFTLNEITELSKERYCERSLKTVLPWDGLCGVHTYNRVQNIELIDGKKMMPLNQV